jgi:hypothetical protein
MPSEFHSAHFTTYFPKIRFNITLLSTPISLKQSLSFQFTKQNTVCFSRFSHTFTLGSGMYVHVRRQMPLLIVALNFCQNKPFLPVHGGITIAAANTTFDQTQSGTFHYVN